jgi:glycosyltransferase involved in cell wall biosynthesis
VTLRKGILDLACCVDTLHSRYPDLEFTVDIVGRIDDLELYQKIKIFLQDANCINHINFHGPMSRKLLTAMYRDSSILVHPSRSEAFPRVLVEAMNYGLPCVTTNAGGSSEAVVDGDTGFVVPVGNWQEMAERLALLLKDYTLRKKMATAAIARYRRWFSRSAMSSDILKILDEISHSQGEELNVHTRH